MPRPRHRPFPELVELATVIAIAAAWFAWEAAREALRFGDVPEM